MQSHTPYKPTKVTPDQQPPAAGLAHPSYVKAHIVALPPYGTLSQRLKNLAIRSGGTVFQDPDTGDASFPCTLPNALTNVAIEDQSGRLIGVIAQGEIRADVPDGFITYPTILPDDLLAALSGKDW